MQHVYSSPKSVTAGVRPCPLAMQHFYSCVSQACHWWCPPFSAGHVAFLFICLRGLSLLVSALFRWRCNISIGLFPRSVTGGVRPFPLAMQHVYSSPRSVTAGVRPCPLAMQHFYSCVPGLPLVAPALFRWHFYSCVSQVCRWCVLVYWP